MAKLWRFLSGNCEILAWLGGGAVVVAGGIWTGVTFFGAEPSPSKVPTNCLIEANRGAAACGNQTFQAPVSIGRGRSSEQKR